MEAQDLAGIYDRLVAAALTGLLAGPGAYLANPEKVAEISRLAVLYADATMEILRGGRSG